jgi:hypothetical protein
MSLNDSWREAYGTAEALSASDRRSCGTMAANQMMMEQFPVFRRILSELEAETSQRLAEPAAYAEWEEVVIPVVVHVIAPDQQAIIDSQIQSQIDVLNEDFSATNADRGKIPTAPWSALSVDTMIRFRLADRDPQGNPHSGITRTISDAAFRADDAMKRAATGGHDAWDAHSYLNIWVCSLDGLLGYAQFPGGNPETDGVVININHFGRGGSAIAPYDRGRTGTHEVGHWLNLRHIWGDTEDCSGSDFVPDTPKQRLPNYSVPTFPSPSCNNAPDGDMFVNYMDYVDDEAMFMFTRGQAARMRTTIATIRSSLIDSAGLSAVSAMV